MHAVIRNIVARTYKPLLVKYLSTTRIYRAEGLQLAIPPAVFHPGFFFSTRILLNSIKKLELKNKTFLEPGCGSGLISLYAAKQGAQVTSTDINAVAVDYLKMNSVQNGLQIRIIESDLFEQIPTMHFDIIAINPPYYKKNAEIAKDYAWCCGENGEYFANLFKGLGNYVHRSSIVLMVLFEGCDRKMINEYAASYGFTMQLSETHQNLLEKNFIYQIVRS